MDRISFLKSLAALPLMSSINKLSDLHKAIEPLESSSILMPSLFIGHGSPMNAIELNEFSLQWQKLGKELPKPKMILCISAHWETKGTFVTATPKPETIHDFGGFPQALFDVQYPAPGSKEWASETKNTISSTTVGLDETWGLDHGTWSILKHVYPNADIPVLQLSIDYTKDATYHYALAKELSTLRSKGVLIIGSGNIVHNLGMVDWSKLKTPEYGYDWAIEVNTKVKKFISEGNHTDLINYGKQGKAFNLAIPSAEHYLPLLYILALQNKNEKASFFNDKAVMGSLTMTSVKIG